MSPGALDIIFAAVALLGALASAWYYVAAILYRDRALSKTAGAVLVGFCMATHKCLEVRQA